MRLVLGSDPADTRGRKALAKVIESGVSQTEVARAVGAPQPAVSQWVHGKRRPSAKYRRQFSLRYGIDEASWMTREEYAGERRAG